MSDLARLGFEFDGQGATEAENSLNRVAGAAGRVEAATQGAERATDHLARAARHGGATGEMFATIMRDQERHMMAVKNATGLTATETLNLTRQFTDVGVSVASGMPIWMVAIQQGAQIGDVFQTAAQRGVGFQAAIAGINAQISALYLRLTPMLAVLAPLAVGFAAVGGAASLAARSANKEFGDLEKGLGLTDAQLKKVTDSSISMGDIVVATFQEAGEALADAFDGPIKAAQRSTTAFLDDLTANTVREIKAIVGSFTGAYGVIRDTWRMLPAAIGDAAVTAANGVITGLNFMIRKSVEGINELRRQYNTLPEWMRGGQAAPMMNAPQLSMIANPYAGGMSAVGAQAGVSFARDRAAGEAAVDRGFGAIGRRAEANEIANIRRQAGEDDSSAGGGSGPAAREAREVREVLQQLPNINLRPLNVALIELADPLKLMADELARIDDMAVRTAYGLAESFGTAGRAAGDLLTTMTAYGVELNRLAQMERDGADVSRDRAFAQVAYYGDMVGAAKGFFKEGSEGYQVLQAAEAAWRLFQFAMSVQAMAQTAAETGVSVSGSMARGAASAAAGAAKMFEALGPFAFPLVAAMIGLLASFGLKGLSGGGGGGAGGGKQSDTVGESVDRVRASGDRQIAAQQGFASSVASRVEVKVTADRDGLNAYVAGVAEDTARPMVAQGMAATAGAVRAQAAQDMDRTYARAR